MCLWALVRLLTLKTHTRKASVTWNSVWTHTVTVKERRTFIVDCRANDRVYEFINWVYSVPRLWKSWTTAQWATNRQRKSERAKMKWNKTAATTIAYLARIELIYLCVFVCVCTSTKIIIWRKKMYVSTHHATSLLSRFECEYFDLYLYGGHSQLHLHAAHSVSFTPSSF